MIEIRRLDKSIPEHIDFLKKIYKEGKHTDFFRRMPKEWSTEELLNIEQLISGICYLTYHKDEPIGLGCVTNVDFYYCFSADMGFILDEKWRDFKIGDLKAAFWVGEAFCRYLFTTARFHKLRIRIMGYREDLYKSFVNAGFVLEAKLLENIYYRGKFHDECDMVLFRSKFEEMYGKIE